MCVVVWGNWSPVGLGQPLRRHAGRRPEHGVQQVDAVVAAVGLQVVVSDAKVAVGARGGGVFGAGFLDGQGVGEEQFQVGGARVHGRGRGGAGRGGRRRGRGHRGRRRRWARRRRFFRRGGAGGRGRPVGVVGRVGAPHLAGRGRPHRVENRAGTGGAQASRAAATVDQRVARARGPNGDEQPANRQGAGRDAKRPHHHEQVRVSPLPPTLPAPSLCIVVCVSPPPALQHSSNTAHAHVPAQQQTESLPRS